MGDSSYVKGLPIKVKVDEINEHGEAVSREILSSFQDAYTSEFEEMYKCLVDGKPIKTNAEDALNELRLFDIMYKKYDRDQENAIVTSVTIVRSRWTLAAARERTI
jgi:hypothetical protein